MGNEEQIQTPTISPEKQELLTKTAGNLAIYDLVEDKILIKIKCHKEPIGFIAFDKTETLLCTASISGLYVNVIKLHSTVKRKDGKKTIKLTAQLLYRLHRGQTTGKITDIRFTSDSKWVAVCTAKGTTHLFPINLDGKPVTTRTHTPLGEKVINDSFNFDDTITTQSQQIYAKSRLKFSSDFDFLPHSFCCEFIPGKSRKILLITPQGLLQQYQLEPKRVYDHDGNAELKLETIPELEWDINRKLNMQIVRADFNNLLHDHHQNNQNDTNWASYSESQTCNFKLLEANKVMISKRILFHFQYYDDDPNDLSETQFPDYKESFVFCCFF